MRPSSGTCQVQSAVWNVLDWCILRCTQSPEVVCAWQEWGPFRKASRRDTSCCLLEESALVQQWEEVLSAEGRQGEAGERQQPALTAVCKPCVCTW